LPRGRLPTNPQSLTHYTLRPSPFTLHPAPYTLQPAPYTLHRTPCTHPTPYTRYMFCRRADVLTSTRFCSLMRYSIQIIHALPTLFHTRFWHHDAKPSCSIEWRNTPESKKGSPKVNFPSRAVVFKIASQYWRF